MLACGEMWGALRCFLGVLVVLFPYLLPIITSAALVAVGMRLFERDPKKGSQYYFGVGVACLGAVICIAYIVCICVAARLGWLD